MVLCLTIVKSMGEMWSRDTAALIPKIESRKDLTSSLRFKKTNTSTKIQTSPFKMRSDGMITLMPMGLVCHNMRAVLIGKEYEMNILLQMVTRSGVHQVYPCMIFDKVKLEIAGSWQQRVL